MNPSQATLLGLFGGQSRTGHELFALTSQLMRPYWSTTRSQIYRELTQMEAYGLIEIDKTKPSYRASRHYRTTEAGDAAFKDWLMSPVQETLIRDNLAIRIAFGDRLPKRSLVKLVNQGIEDSQKRLTAIQKLQKDLSETGLVWDVQALRLSEMQQETTIQWLNEVKNTVTNK